MESHNDLDMMLHPKRWPHHVVLPLKRHMKDGETCGNDMSNTMRTQFALLVFVHGGFVIAKDVTLYSASPELLKEKAELAHPADLVEQGWIVD